MKKIVISIALALLFIPSLQAKEAPNVVVSIKPLHSLVQGVMGKTGSAKLLVSGFSSPHGFHLKPSQMKTLTEADIVFYVDDSFETFLDRAFDAMPKTLEKRAMSDIDGLTILSRRSGGGWESHQHDESEHDDHDHDHDSEEISHDKNKQNDMHLWLDIDNAKKMATDIKKELSALYPENAEIYAENTKKMLANLEAADTKLKQKLITVKDKPFIVFHDAYQYFERRYGLTAVGSITFEPHESPSIGRIQEVRAKIEEEGAECVFKEPQFSEKLVNTVTEGTAAKNGILDPLGANVKDGPELYFQVLDTLAENLTRCLSQ
jgi:zinc transport system substrate-binding protein